MKHKVAELEGALLDAAVAKANGDHEWFVNAVVAGAAAANYSSSWAMGGPIIERERIGVAHTTVEWGSSHWQDPVHFKGHIQTSGRTPLIAAMRAYVASKFGDEVELG